MAAPASALYASNEIKINTEKKKPKAAKSCERQHAARTRGILGLVRVRRQGGRSDRVLDEALLIPPFFSRTVRGPERRGQVTLRGTQSQVTTATAVQKSTEDQSLASRVTWARAGRTPRPVKREPPPGVATTPGASLRGGGEPATE